MVIPEASRIIEATRTYHPDANAYVIMRCDFRSCQRRRNNTRAKMNLAYYVKTMAGSERFAGSFASVSLT